MCEELVRREIRRNVGDINLPERDVGSVGVGAGIPRGCELRDGDAAVDSLAWLAEGEEGTVDMAERHEAIALGLTGGLVEDHDGLLELAVGREQGAEAVGGCVPTEAADEELALGDVGVGDGADGGEDVGVTGDGVL